MVAEVPFVDCLTTILDETLPLTVLEWEEWGNPVEDPAIYRVMKSYSPYDNVRSVDDRGTPVRYPDILATAGLSDPRVGFWEPAKWVAKLRAANPENRVLLKTEIGAGHGGPVGSLRRLEGRGLRLRLHPRCPGPGRPHPGSLTRRPAGPQGRTAAGRLSLPGWWSTGWSGPARSSPPAGGSPTAGRWPRTGCAAASGR